MSQCGRQHVFERLLELGIAQKWHDDWAWIVGPVNVAEHGNTAQCSLGSGSVGFLHVSGQTDHVQDLNIINVMFSQQATCGETLTIFGTEFVEACPHCLDVGCICRQNSVSGESAMAFRRM